MNPDTFKSLPEKLLEIIDIHTEKIYKETFPEYSSDQEVIDNFVGLFTIIRRFSKYSFPYGCRQLDNGDMEVYSHNYGLNTMEILYFKSTPGEEQPYETPTILEYVDPSQETLVKNAQFIMAVYSYL